ncbi:MAG TPA: lycopene cyclase domain-containing protein [Motilibacteraceae bacterium]|nr:lycopene cyclase domain-containing protein [Motilibacteraceae bacterium]
MDALRHLAYVGMLVFCLLGTLPLELVIGTRVYARWRRLLLTLAPVVVVFVLWDLYAIARDQWHFDPAQMLGVTLPGGLPLEELLFFLVVPVASVLTLEAVRRVRGWRVGDEPADEASPVGSPS